MFKKSNKPQKTFEELLTPPTVNIAPSVVISQQTEYRPCYVNGRRALFHRWINTANPALPRGVDATDEKARFFQHRSTHGLVEYADGSLARVWPQEIRFADTAARFKEYDWGQERQEGGHESR